MWNVKGSHPVLLVLSGVEQWSVDKSCTAPVCGTGGALGAHTRYVMNGEVKMHYVVG